MLCSNSNSTDFREGKIKLKSGQFQTLVYCGDCGQIMERRGVRPIEPKVRKTWAERKAEAAKREADRPKPMTCVERKARKGLNPNSAPTQLPNTEYKPPSQSPDGAEPF